MEGTVTKGGRSLHSVEVVFLTDAGTMGPRAIGRTDESGHYRLRTDNGDDGVVTGKYRVVLLDLEIRHKQFWPHFRGLQKKETTRLSPENAKRLPSALKTAEDILRLPPSYGSITETPLHAEVGRERLVFDIAIP